MARKEPPEGSIPAGSGRQIARADFGRKLQQALDNKNWSRADLVNAVNRILDDASFSRNHVSKYLMGSAFPRDRYIKAMAKALGMAPDALYPRFRQALMNTENTPFDMRDLGNGRCWVRVNMDMPLSAAIVIMETINATRKSDPDNRPSRRPS